MTVVKHWTHEQAREAQQRFIDAGGNWADPTSPFSQWVGLHKLDAYEQSFKSGNKYALMCALRECARASLPMPDWVATAYIGAFDCVSFYRAKTWDDVFGPALPKGAQLAALRKRLMKSVQVWNAVNERHKRGEAIDDALFADVGQKLALGLSLTKEYYAFMKSRIRPPRA
ncbi:MAG: hypothetical protein AB7G76_06320 [Steroidobacteraceae bacterium]